MQIVFCLFLKGDNHLWENTTFCVLVYSEIIEITF